MGVCLGYCFAPLTVVHNFVHTKKYIFLAFTKVWYTREYNRVLCVSDFSSFYIVNLVISFLTLFQIFMAYAKVQYYRIARKFANIAKQNKPYASGTK